MDAARIYMEGVARAGGLPLMLPLTDADTEQMLDVCDGVLLTGGQDVSPAVYGEAASPACGECCPERDRMEMPLLLEALKQNKAVLGICRGLQFINAALGGTLYQDLPAQRPSDCNHHMAAPYDREAHRVVLEPEMPLADLMQTTEIGVNSCHHQGINALAPGLSVMASAPDGLIEAVCMPEKRFVWAVQWHPEFWPEDETSRRIFAAFVRGASGFNP